jgi:hypothetical protein
MLWESIFQCFLTAMSHFFNVYEHSAGPRQTVLMHYHLLVSVAPQNTFTYLTMSGLCNAYCILIFSMLLEALKNWHFCCWFILRLRKSVKRKLCSLISCTHNSELNNSLVFLWQKLLAGKQVEIQREIISSYFLHLAFFSRPLSYHTFIHCLFSSLKVRISATLLYFSWHNL